MVSHVLTYHILLTTRTPPPRGGEGAETQLIVEDQLPLILVVCVLSYTCNSLPHAPRKNASSLRPRPLYYLLYTITAILH